MIECETCKKKISKNAKICPNCGERTLYGIKNRKKMTENIIVIIIAAIASIIGFMYVIKINNIKGSWKKTENYNKDESTLYKSKVFQGKQTTIYKFKNNNKCKRTTIIDGDEISKQVEVNGTIRGINITRPFRREVDDNCTYELDNNKIYIKFENSSEESFYIRTEKNNLYLDGDKYARIN